MSSTPVFKIEPLPWDTDLFGIRIGKLVAGKEIERISRNDLRNSAAGYNLVYIFSPNPITKDFDCFSDCKVEYSVLNPDGTAVYENIGPFQGTDTEELIPLAFQSGQFSRFRLDSRFSPDVFDKLYTEWVVRSVNRIIADEINVYKSQDEQIAGFITLAKRPDHCEIGLLGVDATVRGKGIGRQLIASAFQFTVKNSMTELRVATQERNIIARKFYESCGFSLIRKTFIYHYWTKDHDSI
jgi:dTDP-4-amino-4,6-dideoxy-D-galactose acyltransferase